MELPKGSLRASRKEWPTEYRLVYPQMGLLTELRKA